MRHVEGVSVSRSGAMQIRQPPTRTSRKHLVKPLPTLSSTIRQVEIHFSNILIQQLTLPYTSATGHSVASPRAASTQQHTPSSATRAIDRSAVGSLRPTTQLSPSQLQNTIDDLDHGPPHSVSSGEGISPTGLFVPSSTC
jgi:hypothetical protein